MCKLPVRLQLFLNSSKWLANSTCHSYQRTKKEDPSRFSGCCCSLRFRGQLLLRVSNTRAGILPEPWHENHQVYHCFITVPILRQLWFSKHWSEWLAVWSASHEKSTVTVLTVQLAPGISQYCCEVKWQFNILLQLLFPSLIPRPREIPFPVSHQ